MEMHWGPVLAFDEATGQYLPLCVKCGEPKTEEHECDPSSD